jgi:endonuclease-8
VSAFTSTRPRVAAEGGRLRLVGQNVSGVEARGKHLLLRFEGGAVLHTHMGMTGSWHLYREGSRWRRPPHRARAVVTAGGVVAVCFDAPTVELVPPAQAPPLAALGPDVVAPDFDLAEARRRLRSRPEREIGAALLDQTALAGIGNIHKSEALFACGVSPFARVGALDDAALDRLVRTASRRMRESVLGGGRSRGAWVYGRAYRPCRRCGTRIERAAQGRPPRSTYWCPSCQGRKDRGPLASWKAIE